MDSNKDIQKTENITRFVDKQTLRTHAFGDNKMAERAYRRAERLVAAIHLLTNHIDPLEPIRKIIRESATKMLSEILSLRDEMRTVGSSKTYSIEASVRHLISLARILAVSGFVSFENADVLTEALDDLGAFIETSRRSVLSENIRLSRDDLLDVRENPREEAKAIKDKDIVKDSNNIKDKSASIGNVLYEKDARNSRRIEGILEVLRGASDLGIKDILVNLPEYSEKMIQRDLADLVEAGTVKKIGLRRWSKYALSTTELTPGSTAESTHQAGSSLPPSNPSPGSAEGTPTL